MAKYAQKCFHAFHLKKMQVDRDNVRIASRINGTGGTTLKRQNDNTLILEKDHGFIKYHLNRNFGPRNTQQDVFEYYTSRIDNFINHELETSIIAYGQTGSGKTYTIFGEGYDDLKRGLMSRIVSYLIDTIHYRYGDQNDDKLQKECPILTVSMFEIYGEKVYDLLSPDLNEVKIRERGGSAYVSNLCQFEMNSKRNATELILNG